ncbi:MAG: regulatory protein SpoVG [Peptococcaceae bacterium BICA1-8]|nr:MAG: regulatory protein SpoVG [Clostridiaceae bacterium BRH_c20a]KJS85663.1 MAG: regulatory protein SpoVG [Peptococcaceae bacterium BICA1-8]
MNITDVRIRKINVDGRMKAIVSVTFDDAFVVHDVKVVEGQKGLFVAMPSKKMPDGEFRDIAHPISSTARDVIQSAVLKAYEEAM